MTKANLDDLLSLLDVRLDAFAMCEIDRSCGLACPPLEAIVVHFVLEGEGVIDCEHGRYPLAPGSVIIVPRGLAKTIEGPAPILATMPLDEGCPLAPGLVRFRASAGGSPGLVLGCGSVSVSLGGLRGLFDHLDRPLLEAQASRALLLLFEAMAAELRRPAPGTKVMVEALMKQIFVVVLRAHLARSACETPLHLMALNPQLGRAIAAIVARPQDAHSVASLAALAGMSRSSFNRQFVASYGTTPMDFVQSARLSAGARLLTGSDLPVKSVAASVGYASRSHFSRAFSARFGVDPTQYRSHPEAAAAPAAAAPAAAAS